MTTKLHINISQGIIDVEGDPELVRDIYSDFKAQLLAGSKPATVHVASPSTSIKDDALHDPTAKPKAKRRVGTKKKATGDDIGSGIVANSPKLDKYLDTSALPAFYAAYEPKNNPEKILVFLKFLTETINIDEPNTDQVFTCFKKVNEKIPKAFAQAFHDTSTKNGYIDFKSPTDIKITIAGDNHINHSMKKKSSE